jgi:hypothetical protein
MLRWVNTIATHCKMMVANEGVVAVMGVQGIRP